MLCYCDKCGNICEAFTDELEDGCFCCGNSPLKPIPREYIDNFRWRDGDGEQAFIEEVVKKSPNLDQFLFEHKDEIINRKNDEINASVARGKAILEEQNRRITCSYCGSTNVRKIGFLNRAISTEFWGLGSKKIGKQWHCNHCGSDF